MDFFRVAIPLIALITWTGCTDNDGAGGQATTIKLLDEGLEPRHAMRYRFQKGRSRTLQTTIRSGGKNGGQSSGIDATVVLHQKDIRTIGDLHHHFEITSVRSSGNPEALLAESVAALAGTRGRAVVSASGHRRSIHFQHADNEVKGLACILRQQLLQLPVPLPEDAIGVGAKWEAEMPAGALSDSARQKGTYELVYRGEHESRLKVCLELTDKNEIVARANGTMRVDNEGPLPRVDLKLELTKTGKTLVIKTERIPEQPD